MIKILKYGSGNIAAIASIYDRLQIQCEFASVESDLANASKIILPGVGAFDQTMESLRRSKMLECLNYMVLRRNIPVLGVCVGMQIMGNESEEGESRGLGWIPGRVRKLKVKLKSSKPHLPHMGWNNIESDIVHPILDGIDVERGFYFLHSYCFECQNKENTLSVTYYGEKFASAVYKDNIFGFQFHPEKSHSNGIRLFENFAKL